MIKIIDWLIDKEYRMYMFFLVFIGILFGIIFLV